MTSATSHRPGPAPDARARPQNRTRAPDAHRPRLISRWMQRRAECRPKASVQAHAMRVIGAASPEHAQNQRVTRDFVRRRLGQRQQQLQQNGPRHQRHHARPLTHLRRQASRPLPNAQSVSAPGQPTCDRRSGRVSGSASPQQRGRFRFTGRRRPSDAIEGGRSRIRAKSARRAAARTRRSTCQCSRACRPARSGSAGGCRSIPRSRVAGSS